MSGDNHRPTDPPSNRIKSPANDNVIDFGNAVRQRQGQPALDMTEVRFAKIKGEKHLRSESFDAKIHGIGSSLFAALSLYGAIHSLRQAFVKDQEGHTHVQWNQLTWAAFQGAIAGYMTFAAHRNFKGSREAQEFADSLAGPGPVPSR